MTTTDHREYIEIPGGVSPDFRYWINRLANEIDVDVQEVADALGLATSDLGTVKITVTDHGTRISTAEGSISSQGGRLTTAEGKITTNTNSITSHGTRISTAEGTIGSHTTTLSAIGDPTKVLKHRGELPNGTDLNTMQGAAWNGIWTIKNTTSAATMVNLPPELLTTATEIWNWTGTNGIVHQRAEGYGTGFVECKRATANLAGTAWVAWKNLDALIKANTDAIAANTAAINANKLTLDDHTSAAWLGRSLAIQQRFRERHGNTVPVGKKAVFTFKYDHDVNNFGDIVIPIHRAHRAPAHLAIMSEMFTTANGVERNNLRTWADIDSWAINDAVELSNHGNNHRDAQTLPELVAAWITSLDTYKTQLPRCVVEIATVPGVSGSTPPGKISFGGFANGATLEAFTDTVCGRAMLGFHPVCMGYSGGLYRTLDGNIMQGLSHYTMDEVTDPATITAMMDTAVSLGVGIAFMTHPSSINQPGMITGAILNTIVGYARSLVDAGKAEILTVAGLTLADNTKTEDQAYNLIENPSFKNGFTGWAGSSGYTIDGVTGKVSGTAAAGLLTRTVALSRLDWAKGAVWKLKGEIVAGDAELVASFAVEDSTDTTKLSRTDTQTIAANGTGKFEVPITIPVTGTTSLRIKAGRVSGGAVTEIRNIRMVAG